MKPTHLGPEEAYVKHSCVVDIHCLLRVGSAIFVVEVDASIVDQYVHAAVLGDLFGEASDTAAIRDIQLRVNHTAGGVV